MQKIIFTIMFLSLIGCAPTGQKPDATRDLINAEMSKAAQVTVPPAQDDVVAASLLPPLKIEVPTPRKPFEEKFDLTFSNAPANQFFMAIVSGTRYSMLIHPEVTGMISANLKDVTVFEALDAIRELYGYDYRVEGKRIYIKPLTLQTRLFHVNYLTSNRKGTSDIRVSSGSVSDMTPTRQNTGAGAAANGAANSDSNSQTLNSSNISTTSNNDFWGELKASLEAIVGTSKEGRSVVISPQSGVVVIRAMPEELRNVDAYLKATQLSVDRQVILEAKILEVQLNDSFQAGINWASFASFRGNHGNRVSTGFVAPGASLTPLPYTGGIPAPLVGGEGAVTATTGFALGAPSNAMGSLFGLAMQTSNFAALISFLESQGSVNVLSSPRIATMNNQKAVLKVGTDEFFVTRLTTTPATTTGNTTTGVSATVEVHPFFSGVALDVTPQIDASGNIILHIHPSVSNVKTVDKVISLGSGESLNMPLASSAVSETDSVVRGRDGQIVAIGGLMRQSSTSDRSQVPGLGDTPVVGALFKNTNKIMQKRELVILLKPTIVQGDESWTQDLLDTQRRIVNLDPRSNSSQK